MKISFLKSVTLFFFCLISFFINAQPISLTSGLDSLLPVTDNFYEPAVNYQYINRIGSEVFKVVPNSGKYFLLGNFTNLTATKGSSFLLDSGTLAINSSSKWAINGLVKASVPDGQGGFYIGGTFTKIGDSTCKYIAHVNSVGQPLPWNVSADNYVNAMYIRRDTLFIGGRFIRIANQTRYVFAMYSLQQSNLLPVGGTGQFANMVTINAFVIKRDTVTYAGYGYNGYQAIKKYNFRNNSFLPWQLSAAEYKEITQLQLDKDSVSLIYATDGPPNYVRSVRYDNGAYQYQLNLTIYLSSQPNNGSITGLKVVGSKVYAVGHFEYALNNTTNIRKGFVCFDAVTGTVLPENLNANGHAVFIQERNGRLLISGKFSSINNVPRNNFACVDTGTLQLSSMELSPTDEILNMCYSGSTLFIAGNFNGIRSTRRNGFAAIDSATKTILPWNPLLPNVLYDCKRAFIRGDTLFVLGYSSNDRNCVVNDYVPQFLMFSITTGAQLAGPTVNCCRVDDIMIDGNFLYASSNNIIKRYNLPSLVQDNSWIVYFYPLQTPIYLLATADKIISIGDNRFVDRCTNLPDRKGFVGLFSKTGNPNTGAISYSYTGNAPAYDEIDFEKGLLSSNKLYIQGYFNALNGLTRRNFVCINLLNGSITNWNPTFPNTDITFSPLSHTSALKMINGKIWFGSSSLAQLSDSTYFSGFGAIDTISGGLQLPPLISAVRHTATVIEDIFYKNGTVNDFLFENNRLIIFGSFDSVNAVKCSNIASYRINAGILVTYTFIGSGNWSNPSNWSNGMLPPTTLPTGAEIIINPSSGDCILDRQQTIGLGAKLTVVVGKKFIIPGDLLIQ